jgi:hypothetical protein
MRLLRLGIIPQKIETIFHVNTEIYASAKMVHSSLIPSFGCKEIVENK